MYKLKGLALKNKGHKNFEERCDLMKNIFSMFIFQVMYHFPQNSSNTISEEDLQLLLMETVQQHQQHIKACKGWFGSINFLSLGLGFGFSSGKEFLAKSSLQI